MIRTGQLPLICPPLAHSLLSLAAPWGRNIIAQIGQLVNRQIAQILFFVQFAQNDTHGTVDGFLSTIDKQLFIEKSLKNADFGFLAIFQKSAFFKLFYRKCTRCTKPSNFKACDLCIILYCNLLNTCYNDRRKGEHKNTTQAQKTAEKKFKNFSKRGLTTRIGCGIM